MNIYKVTFHWLETQSGDLDVVGDDIFDAGNKALKLEKEKGCAYTENNILKIELISRAREVR